MKNEEFSCGLVVMAVGIALLAFPGGEAVGAPGEDALYTNVYQVPPTFVTNGDSRPPIDPFAPDAEALKPRPTAIEILRAVGIVFPEGASAVYNPSSSQLIVRNTLAQMDLVEAYIETVVNQVQMQVYVTTLFAESDTRLFDPPAEVAAERAAESDGGIVRTLHLESSQDLVELLAAEDMVAAMEEHGINQLLLGINAVFTDSQLQLLRKKFAEEKSASLSGGGSVMLRSGQGGYLLTSGERAVGVKEVLIGADGFTIDLALYFQGESARGKGKREVNEVSITIWDGQTIMVERELPKGRFQYDFVTARLKDPSGQNINGEAFPAQEVPEVPEVELPSAPVSEEKTIETLRRVEKADQAALRGNQQMADEDYEEAQKSFLKALQTLPDIDETEDRESAYLQQWLKAMRAAKTAE